MRQYLQLLNDLLQRGVPRQDRTGTGTRSIFGYQMHFPLQEGFPLLTTKKMRWKSIVCELLWFLRGESNISFLRKHDVHIWDAWADSRGELGPIYGVQWRRWKTARKSHVDQIAHVIQTLQTDPQSRRHIVSAWNVGEIDEMALPPCHLLVQFYVQDRTLSCQLYQRSGDAFLGVPFNIASYALLTHMVAQVCDMQVGTFVHTLGDVHLYVNHLTQAREQVQRKPYPLPRLVLDKKIRHIDDFTLDSIALHDYHAHPHIKAPISV